MSQDSELPRATIGDHAHTAAKVIIGGALGNIPVIGGLVGGAAVEAFSAIVAPPVERRREAFMRSVVERLTALEHAGKVDASKLPDNESFITTALQAVQIAMRNHDEAKIEALRNAVINSATPDAPEDSQQQMFLRWVDELTPWHLRLLRLARDPEDFFRDTGGKLPEFVFSSSMHEVITQAFPDLRARDDFLQVLAADLSARGLADIGGMKTMMTASGWRGKRTKTLGDAFLKFITEAK